MSLAQARRDRSSCSPIMVTRAHPAGRFAGSMLLACLASGCSGSSPASSVGPTPLAQISASSCAPTIACALLPFGLAGRATDDDGRPVPAAHITMRPFTYPQADAALSTATDATGFYRFDFMAMRDAVGGVGSAMAERDGYESDSRYIGPRAASEIAQDFRLYRIRKITPGESVSLTVQPDDPSCGFDDEWVCRTVRITIAAAGTLTATLVSQDARAQTGLQIVVPCRGPCLPTSCCGLEQSREVPAGTEVLARILLWWTATDRHSFTLRTSFIRQ